MVSKAFAVMESVDFVGCFPEENMVVVLVVDSVDNKEPVLVQERYIVVVLVDYIVVVHFLIRKYGSCN